MNAIESASAQVGADRREVLRLVSEGNRGTEPELRRRIHERSEAMQREMREKFGIVEIAVDLIREGRDEG